MILGGRRPHGQGNNPSKRSKIVLSFWGQSMFIKSGLFYHGCFVINYYRRFKT